MALHHLHRDVGHLRNGGLEDGLAVPHDGVPVVGQGLGRSGVTRTAGLHVELQLAGTVGTQHRIDDAQTLGIGLQQHGSGTVAEERAGGTVGVVDDRRHLVGADDDDLLGSAGLDELGAGRKREEEARAGGRNVVGESVLASGLVGDEVARRGEEHVGRDGGADDDVDLHGIDAGLVQQVHHGPGAHVGGADALALEDMARTDTGMGDDPLVVGIDHPAQFVVGKQVVGQILADTRYRSCNFSHCVVGNLDYSVNACCSRAVNPAWMHRSVVRIMFLMARGDEQPWPMTTGALTPSTGVPPTFS